jgi:hypothetical protein
MLPAQIWISLDFIVWLDLGMKFDFDEQVHVASSSSYLML